jgi:hypothetical protein
VADVSNLAPAALHHGPPGLTPILVAAAVIGGLLVVL